MLCKFCLAEIPKSRLERDNAPKSGIRQTKYCSDLCNKRAWYMRNRKPENSVFKDNPQTGIAWENWFIKKFGATRPSASHGTPFDFWYEDQRVDLKVCELYLHKNLKKRSNGWWVFLPGKRRDEVDTFICIGLRYGKPEKMFKIPESEFTKGGISISPNKSKWDKFEIPLSG